MEHVMSAVITIREEGPRPVQTEEADDLQPGLLLRLLDEIDYGLVLVDAQGRIQHANHLARHELATGRLLFTGQNGAVMGCNALLGDQLITAFIANINNFNVIYLLTQDVYFTMDTKLAASNAKDIDLLVTWLFRLTNDSYNYKMASVIGILVFIVCAVFTLLAFNYTFRKGVEDKFQ